MIVRLSIMPTAGSQPPESAGVVRLRTQQARITYGAPRPRAEHSHSTPLALLPSGSTNARAAGDPGLRWDGRK